MMEFKYHLAALVGAVSLAGSSCYGWGFMPGGSGMMGYGYGGMIMMWILILAVGGGVIYFFWRQSQEGRVKPGPGEDALTILKERYARGEINREEYEQKKQDLETT